MSAGIRLDAFQATAIEIHTDVKMKLKKALRQLAIFAKVVEKRYLLFVTAFVLTDLLTLLCCHLNQTFHSIFL